MKSILMTTSAVLLVTGFAAGQAQAACPEDIDAFNREYEETLQSAAAGEALSTSEQAQLFGLRTAAENLHEAGKAEMCAEVIQRASAILESAIAPLVMKPDDLIGREVTNAAEENLGEIEDVMIDPVSGRIAYVVIEHGGFLGIGDDLFAVPWRAMQFVPGNDRAILLEIAEEKLENAPRFSREDHTPLERREWVTAVHNYYGVQPYWQDDISALAMQYGGGGTGGVPEGTAGGQAQADIVVVAPIEEGESASEAGSETEAQPTDSAAAPAAESETEAEASTETATGTQTETEHSAETGMQPATEAQPATGSAGESGQSSDTSGQSSVEPQSGGMALVTPSTESGEVPSADVEALVARLDELEQQVRTLSEQMPGEEMKQTLTRIEDQLAALKSGSAAAAEGGGESGQGGEPAAVVVVPGSGEGDGSQGDAASRSGEPDQSGAAQSEEAGQSEAAQPSENAGQPDSALGGEQQSEAQADEQEVATTEATSELEGQPCEEQIAQLEEDLERAEQLGVAVNDAQSELKEAQAMLSNKSEALCRAAIKRAQEELVAVGFEPTELN